MDFDISSGILGVAFPLYFFCTKFWCAKSVTCQYTDGNYTKILISTICTRMYRSQVQFVFKVSVLSVPGHSCAQFCGQCCGHMIDTDCQTTRLPTVVWRRDPELFWWLLFRMWLAPRRTRCPVICSFGVFLSRMSGGRISTQEKIYTLPPLWYIVCFLGWNGGPRHRYAVKKKDTWRSTLLFQFLWVSGNAVKSDVLESTA